MNSNLIVNKFPQKDRIKPKLNIAEPEKTELQINIGTQVSVDRQAKYMSHAMPMLNLFDVDNFIINNLVLFSNLWEFLIINNLLIIKNKTVWALHQIYWDWERRPKYFFQHSRQVQKHRLFEPARNKRALPLKNLW